VLHLENSRWYHDGLANPDDDDEGNIEILKALIDNGANPNIQDKGGRTPLHHSRNKNEIEYLLSVGADPTIKDKSGFTAKESYEAYSSLAPIKIPNPHVRGAKRDKEAEKKLEEPLNERKEWAKLLRKNAIEK
jgi:hypothetical protein